jgi:hypothetical protein
MDQVMEYLKAFKFSQSDVDYLASVRDSCYLCSFDPPLSHISGPTIIPLNIQMPSLQGCDPGFFEYLLTLDCSGITVSALQDGTVAFPRVTLISVRTCFFVYLMVYQFESDIHIFSLI